MLTKFWNVIIAVELFAKIALTTRKAETNESVVVNICVLLVVLKMNVESVRFAEKTGVRCVWKEHAWFAEMTEWYNFRRATTACMSANFAKNIHVRFTC